MWKQDGRIHVYAIFRIDKNISLYENIYRRHYGQPGVPVPVGRFDVDVRSQFRNILISAEIFGKISGYLLVTFRHFPKSKIFKSKNSIYTRKRSIDSSASEYVNCFLFICISLQFCT